MSLQRGWFADKNQQTQQKHHKQKPKTPPHFSTPSARQFRKNTVVSILLPMLVSERMPSLKSSPQWFRNTENTEVTQSEIFKQIVNQT